MTSRGEIDRSMPMGPVSINGSLLREQLLAIETGKDFEKTVLRDPLYELGLADPMSKHDFATQWSGCQAAEAFAFEHLTYLVQKELIQGIMILKGFSEYHYGITHLRLTEKGFKVLCKIRSKKKWSEIQLKAPLDDIPLTFDQMVDGAEELANFV